MSSWTEAVKEFAKRNGGKFVIPKRDTDEYKAIRKIQEELGAAPVAAAPVKAPKVKKVKTANVVPAATEEVKPQPRKTVAKVHEKKANPVQAVVEEVKVATAVKAPRKPRKVVAAEKAEAAAVAAEAKVAADEALRKEERGKTRKRVKKVDMKVADTEVRFD